MNKTTYKFHGASGVIPGIPGEWQGEVDVDLDTNTVLDVRPKPAIQVTPITEQPKEKPKEDFNASSFEEDAPNTTKEEA